ncbi:hypothetical protein BH10CYA1_BH10CYA1_25310 [soil metagenome]
MTRSAMKNNDRNLCKSALTLNLYKLDHMGIRGNILKTYATHGDFRNKFPLRGGVYSSVKHVVLDCEGSA